MPYFSVNLEYSIYEKIFWSFSLSVYTTYYL